MTRGLDAPRLRVALRDALARGDEAAPPEASAPPPAPVEAEATARAAQDPVGTR